MKTALKKKNQTPKPNKILKTQSLEIPQKSLTAYGGQTPLQTVRTWGAFSPHPPSGELSAGPRGAPLAPRRPQRRTGVWPDRERSLPLRLNRGRRPLSAAAAAAPACLPARSPPPGRPRGRWQRQAPQAGRAAPSGGAGRPRGAAAAGNVLPQVLGVAILSVPPAPLQERVKKRRRDVRAGPAAAGRRGLQLRISC